MKKIWALVFIGGYLFFSYISLVTIPEVWPDEPIYVDIAKNILKQGSWNSSLLGPMLPGGNMPAYWNPPLFFALVAGWMALGISSIQFIRTLPFVAGILFIYFYQRTTNLIFSDNRQIWTIVPIGLLLLDPIFIKSMHILRPEIFVLLTGFIALWFYLQTSVNSKYSWWRYLVTGIFCAVSTLLHFLGGFFFICIGIHAMFIRQTSKRLQRIVPFGVMLLSFSLIMGVWLLSVVPHWNAFSTQILSATSHKSFEEPWIITSIKYDQVESVFAHIIRLLFSAIFVLYMLITRKKVFLLPLFFLVVSWGLTTYGKMVWYFVYTLPFAYWVMEIFLRESSRHRDIHLLIWFAVIILILNQVLQIGSLTKFVGKDRAYNEFSDQIAKIIPPGKTVFLSAIPDPYFGLTTKNYYTFYTFPALRTDTSTYIDTLDRSDYVVYTSTYNWLVFGRLQDVYFQKNTVQSFEVENSLYSARVFKLKPRSERIHEF